MQGSAFDRWLKARIPRVKRRSAEQPGQGYATARAPPDPGEASLDPASFSIG